MNDDKIQSTTPDDEYELTFNYFKDELSYMWRALVQETKEEITGSPDKDTFIDCWKALGQEIKGSFSDCGKWVVETIRTKPPAP